MKVRIVFKNHTPSCLAFQHHQVLSTYLLFLPPHTHTHSGQLGGDKMHYTRRYFITQYSSYYDIMLNFVVV